MDHGRFWNTLSRQLENKGLDYVTRCTFRNKPLYTGDNVILPARFSHLPIQEVQEVQEMEPLVKGSEKDLEKVRERLCYEIPASADPGVRFTPCLCMSP